jgi:hypothetical protein
MKLIPDIFFITNIYVTKQLNSKDEPTRQKVLV